MLTQSYPARAGREANDRHLRPWAYVALALISGAGGVAAAVITTRFFVLGLERTEADEPARQALMAAGALMVVVELLAFGLAALLPRTALRAARFKLVALGLALLAFEAGTLYVTQVAMVRTSQAASHSQNTRIQELRASIVAQREAASSLRETSARQAQSSNVWIREAAAKQARQALDVEAKLSGQVTELARLEAASAPTLTDTLGEQGMIAYAVCRSLLIVLMGVVLFAVAGALLRARRTVINAVGLCEPEVVAEPVSQPLPTMRSAGGRFAAAPLAALAAAPAAFAQPQVTVQTTAPAERPTVATPMQSTASTMMRRADAVETDPQQTQHRAVVTHRAVQDSGTGEDDGARFQRVRADILAGRLKPSLRAVYAAHGATQAVARRYLAAMEASGEIQRVGQGYVLSDVSSGT
ncbi:hypothetical protein [Cupriavidus oxalaticus]|uniref:Uncharacterized protein n=1 Tax=Cupriavidus oxalaticus TaxID=96344 RepID=A0A4P7LIW1_9BURK|nr:hypothetical protein [Cupriavidus oxalaticus]QBY56096.1 hypothetical protein E0W60_34155 [Cupriavidus oxalaticus]